MSIHLSTYVPIYLSIYLSIYVYHSTCANYSCRQLEVPASLKSSCHGHGELSQVTSWSHIYIYIYISYLHILNATRISSSVGSSLSPGTQDMSASPAQPSLAVQLWPPFHSHMRPPHGQSMRNHLVYIGERREREAVRTMVCNFVPWCLDSLQWLSSFTMFCQSEEFPFTKIWLKSMTWQETYGGHGLIGSAEGGLSLAIILNDLFEQAWATKWHKYNRCEPVCLVTGNTPSVAHLELIESATKLDTGLSSEV